jgi:exonuclease VII small subunit
VNWVIELIKIKISLLMINGLTLAMNVSLMNKYTSTLLKELHMKNIEKVVNHLESNVMALDSSTIADFDSAIIGYFKSNNQTHLVYSRNKIISIIIDVFSGSEKDVDHSNRMDIATDAIEYYEFNICGAFISENGPVYVLEFNDIHFDLEALEANEMIQSMLSEEYNDAIIGLSEGLHCNHPSNIMYSKKSLEKINPNIDLEEIGSMCIVVNDDMI